MKHLFDLVLFNIGAKLEEDTKHKYIGYFWFVLEPMLSALVYYVVFKLILHHGEENYIVFLFVGIISWKWFSNCVSSGANSIFANRGLYKKIYIPKIIFPWIEVGYSTVKFLIVFAAILVVFRISGHPFTINYAYLPFLVFCQFAFSIGLAVFLAAILPYFVDLKIIIGFFLKLYFYPSGVLFNLKRVPDKYRWIVDYNPMAQGIESIRNIVIKGEAPNMQGLLLMLGLGIAFYLAGYLIVSRLDKAYAKIGV
jgi:lipopolysaccharide transport system permease protein